MSQSSVQDDVALSIALLDLLPKLLRRMSADALMDEEAMRACSGLQDVTELRATPGQLTLLRILVERERCMMQELAEHLVVTPSTVTAMVKRLLAQGYIERSRDDADWRTVWVKPSDRGRQVVAAFNHLQQAAFQRRMVRLSEDERDALAAAVPALRHLIANQ